MKICKQLWLLALLPALLVLCTPREETPSEVAEENLRPHIPFEGKIVFQSNMTGRNRICLLTEKGFTRLTDDGWDSGYPSWSPDGKRIAFTANPHGNYDIFVMNADGSEVIRATDTEDDEKEPSWFPDGRRIAYSRESKRLIRDEVVIFEVDIRTKKTARLFPHYKRINGIPHVSPTAPLVTFTGKKTMGWDVAVYDLAKDEAKFLHDGGNSCRARFSPDGRKLAYVSSEADGKGDIWVMNVDGSGKTRLTMRDDTYDYFPAWSPDGRYIVFNSSRQHNHNGDWAVYVIDIRTLQTSLLFDSPGNDVFPDWR